MNRNVLIVWSLAWLLAGCGNNNVLEKQYGINHNKIRSQLGVPLIEKSWHLKSVRNSEELTWMNPSWRPQMPGHAYKTMVFKSGRLLSEADIFYSGAFFPSREPDGGNDLQSLTVEYSYPTNPGISGKWECRLLLASGVTNISLEAATNLINEWKAKAVPPKGE